jgi:hypothetical protein
MATRTREPNEGLRRHKLMPKALREALPALYAQDGRGDEAVAYGKFFSPYTGYTFYITEFDGEDTLFGSCNGELGYASLTELAETTVFGRVPAIERDCYWTATTLAEAVGT